MVEELDSPRILLVDDEPVTRVRVRHALQECGYDAIKEAADGLEAKGLLQKDAGFDLVVTDILMPGMDGIELLRWGREHVPGPVWILLSGVDTFDAAVEAIRSGAFDFLAKPPKREELEVSVRNALEQHRLTQERDRLYVELEDTNKQLLSKVRDLEDKSELLRRDLQRAEIIQRALLPTVPPAIERYCIHAVYRPGRYVGGDLYDVVRLDDRHIGMYVADATGHGVTAAMLSVLYKQRLVLVDEGSGQPLSPATVLEHVNRSLLEADMAPGLFLTAVFCLLDTKEAELTLASAGHPPALHAQPGGELRQLKRTGPALGLTENAHFDEERIQLKVDDRLLLFTDGLLQPDSTRELDRLQRLLNRYPVGADDLLAEALGTRDGDAIHEEERDDVTVLLLDVHAGPSSFDNGTSKSEKIRSGPISSNETIFYGETDDAGYLSLQGRVIWTHCDPLYEAATGILETGRRLMVDLSECEYLDSTCLGTIHELVALGNVHVQSVRTDVRSLFEELDMNAVLASVEEARALPEMYPLAMGSEAATSQPLRILRAHEALATLSSRNRKKFDEVVEGLRQEIAPE